jgi:hypothetical protein
VGSDMRMGIGSGVRSRSDWRVHDGMCTGPTLDEHRLNILPMLSLGYG